MSARRKGERGQSLVELAIFVPIVIVLLLAVGDLARAFATMITVESAAREAADWGAFRPGNWDTVVPQYPVTVTEMERRACTASLELPDYAGASDGSTCTNPSFNCAIGTTSNPSGSCSSPTTCDVDPCYVKVTLGYDFDLIAPSEFLALPTTFHFDRESVFKVGKDLTVTPP
jgi:hypothetical protein